VPGSSLAFTSAQTGDRFNPADWHPDNHPPAPDVVAHGQKPDVAACGFCHLMNGQGRPESSPLAGLDATFFKKTMADFKAGTRPGSDPKATARMVAIARAVTDDQVEAAAQYFASFKFQPWVQVKEADTVPAYHLTSGEQTTDVQPLGQRIVEVPVDYDRAALRDDQAGYVAYVPVGSISNGQALASGQGGVRPCGRCHGADLRGSAEAPPLAGRSPTYMLRQLFDYKTGGRDNGRMKRVADPLTLDQMISLVAYTASLQP
jgi:cytochrome c553